ncbi:hypothetical protein [Kitasatospora sp. CB01950]|uniref:hypothetical protein n=1 Tax=Kitasatospora sp. CB01950 TaxID=1703930 RepID=UPI001161243E|nr:hypothetical protein [Kitasatospora sp. CB01950]
MALLGMLLIGACATFSGKEGHPDVTGNWAAGEERLEIHPDGRMGDAKILESLCHSELAQSPSVREIGGATWHYKELPSAGPGIGIVLPDFFKPGLPCEVELLITKKGAGVDELTPTSGPTPAKPFRRR